MTKEETKKYWQDREVGAVWVSERSLKIKRKDRDGTPVEFVGFPNRFKNEAKHPNWNLFISEEKKENPAEPTPKSEPVKKQNSAPAPAPAPQSSSEPDPMDDVPF